MSRLRRSRSGSRSPGRRSSGAALVRTGCRRPHCPAPGPAAGETCRRKDGHLVGDDLDAKALNILAMGAADVVDATVATSFLPFRDFMHTTWSAYLATERLLMREVEREWPEQVFPITPATRATRQPHTHIDAAPHSQNSTLNRERRRALGNDGKTWTGRLGATSLSCQACPLLRAACAQCRSCRGVIADFRPPPLPPLARAAVKPAIVRSFTNFRSISATEARMWNSSRPERVAVSKPSVRERKSTFRTDKPAAKSIRPWMERPSRSSFQTTRPTPARAKCSPSPSRPLPRRGGRRSTVAGRRAAARALSG